MCFNHDRQPKTRGRFPTLLLMLLSGAMLGCSGDSEVTKYGIQGTVSLDGNLVAKASLQFAPDSASGTTGPQGFAYAKNGVFNVDTEQGLVAGVFNVRVEVVDESENVLGSASKQITVDPDADNIFDLELTSADLAAGPSGEDGEGEDEGGEDGNGDDVDADDEDEEESD